MKRIRNGGWILLLAVCFVGCSGKGAKDYSSPFSHFYAGAVAGKAFSLQLYRDTSAQSPTYRGVLTDTLEGLPLSVSGFAADSSDKSRITLNLPPNGDTLWQLQGRISGDAKTLEGMRFKIVGDKKLDSAAFSFALSIEEPLFDYYTGSETFRAADSGYTGNTSVSFVWPRHWPDSTTEKAVKKHITGWLDLKDASTANPLKDYLAKARAEFKDDYSDAGANPYFTEQSADDERDVSLLYQGPKWMVLSHSYEHYESGMNHPQGSTGYHTLHRKSGRELALNDFFSAEGLRRLPALVEKYFRLQQNLKPGEPLTKAGLFRNHIAPNKNFYVTGRHLVFHYGNYEIAAFVYGEFDVQIPLEEFKGTLLL